MIKKIIKRQEFLWETTLLGPKQYRIKIYYQIINKKQRLFYNINLRERLAMLQAPTTHPNNVPSHPNMMIPVVLNALHPNNAGNINGKIISRSPAAIQLPDQRSLSPNKLNATKKPMMNAQNQNYPAAMNNQNYPVAMNNYLGRNRSSTSPNPKSPTNAMPNMNMGSNYNNNFINNNININNVKKQPLLNSKGFGRRASDANIPFSNNNIDKTKFCMNHGNKFAEFVTQMQGEQFGYCQKCAINLASKGFSVVRKGEKDQYVNKQSQNDRNFEKIPRPTPFHNPQYIGVLGYSQVQKFMQNIDKIYTEYIQQTQKYQRIQQHYSNQISITNQFYKSLLETVEQMREDHLADLQSQAKKHYQLALIKEDNLKSDLEEMEAIRLDIIESLSIILEGFQTEVIQETFAVYKQKVYALKDKIQEENKDFAKEIINEKQPELQARLKKIQQYLIQVWNDKKPSEEASNRNNQFKPQFVNKQPQIKKIANINPNNRTQNKEIPMKACRKLFDDDQFGQQGERNNQLPYIHHNQQEHKRNYHTQQLAGQTSPQFKNI